MKKVAVLLLRIGVTAGFLSLAFLLIEFHDSVDVAIGAEKFKAARIREDGDALVAVMRDGSERRIPPADAKIAKFVEQPGLPTILKRSNLVMVLLLVPAMLLPIICLALRWRLLLKENGFDFSLNRVFLVTYAGFFFNLVLPGSAGGDIAKALMGTQGESRKAALVGTILLDRIIGLGAMVIMASVMVIPFLGNPDLRFVTNLILVLLAGGIVGYVLYFNGAIRKSGFGQGIKRLLPFPHVIQELDAVMGTMKNARKVVVLAAVTSFFAQASSILIIFALARALHIDGPTVGSFFLMEPIIFIVTAIPVAPGGWGVQEYIYAKLFGLIGVGASAAIALSVLYKLVQLAASVPGGLLFAAGVTSRSDKK